MTVSTLQRRDDLVVMVENVPRCARSLGTGVFPEDGPISFRASPSSTTLNTMTASYSSSSDISSFSPPTPPVIENNDENPPSSLRKRTSSFMRTSDLDIAMSHSSHDQEQESTPHYNCDSEDPPPGISHDPNERWIALDNGEGLHAPIAPIAIEALVKCVLDSTMNQAMWTPNAATHRMMNKHKSWSSVAFQCSGTVPCGSIPNDHDVLVWCGSFSHGLYGSEIPAVRACGAVNMSPHSLMSLLVDSTRVKEYNKMSLGRTDLLTLQNGIDGPFNGITKIVKSESRPPLVRKNMELVSLLHARALPDGAYLLVTRAVTRPSDHSVDAIRSEMLTGVNVILPLEETSERCLMVNVNHMRSPSVPMFLAQKIGLAAAVNFMNDIRRLCK